MDKAIVNYGMLADGDRIFIGVSGGVDCNRSFLGV